MIGAIMNILFNCIAYMHDPVFLALSVITLVCGAVVTLRLFARVRRTENDIRILWLALAGLIGGGTIWSTHFVAMIAYESDFILGYEPVLTFTSLIIAITATTLGFLIASVTKQSYVIEFGGVVLGLGISAMHYTGMMAMKVHGALEWSTVPVIISLITGCFFGAITVNRIARPITRFCKYGGALSFVLAVASMHFVSMSGMTILPSNIQLETPNLISKEFLGIGAFTVMALLLAVSFITNLIDMKTTEVTSKHYEHLALHDPLTGSLNRRGCEQFLDKIIAVGTDDTAGIAVLAVDLDDFKEINEVHGHTTGDHLLCAINERISNVLGNNETLARFGADEFIAIKSSIYTEREAKEFAKRISKAISNPLFKDDLDISTSASIGFSFFPHHGDTSAQLIEKAKLAMYHSKSNGKNGISAYEKSMGEANKERNTLALELSQSIKNGELEVYYQLQNDTHTRAITGVEALLRWNHPTRGIVSPAIFIPIAEENGFICEIGDWVLKQACKQASQWSVPIKVAVNVAPRQLTDRDLPKKVHAILLETGLSPSRLEIEITESGIIADTALALHSIRQLKTLGVKLAMDDYGTGYSSLFTLQNFPFDKIKIDREFIKEINTNKQSSAIVQSTLILGDSLDIPILAEGVETEEHLQFLSKQGCQEVQGYLFGKPMPNSNLVKILDDQAAKANNVAKLNRKPATVTNRSEARRLQAVS
jgi:diguanylate cyclase (GGDEF)-like protein